MKKLKVILQYNTFYLVLLFVSFIYLVIFNISFKVNYKNNINDTNFEFKITDYKINGNLITIYFNSDVIGNYYFNTLEEKNNFSNTYSLGDIILIDGNLEYPSNNTIPNTFNYKKYLKYKKINYILNINSIKKSKQNKNIFLIIKNYLYKRINNIKYNEYLYAFILGKSNYISSESYNNYKINGVTHLFALSGLHVSIFSNILLKLLKKIKFKDKLNYIITSLFLIFFSFIASFTPSILRAVLFFILSSINKIYNLNIKQKNILYLTFIILIIINPLYIHNIGFILSFTITFFILIFNEKNKSSIIKISLLSFLSSFPIIINMSYEINIISFINNIFFIPFVSNIVFPLSLLTLIIPKLSYILNILTTIMEVISKYSSNILNITISFPYINNIFIILYYLFLLLFIKFKDKKYLLAVFLVIIIVKLKPLFNNNTELYFLDVGQGDSLVIKTKNNKSIMIDTGGIIKYKKEEWMEKNKQYNTLINSIIPFMKSIGINKLDYLIITHGDNDHMGYSIDLINNFNVSSVILNCGEFNELEQNLIKILKENKISYSSCINNIDINNNLLYFINNNIYDNENDNSNVIYTKLNNYKFLFMGDAGIKVEEDIIKKYNLKNIDVLKVGHHGSKTSTSKNFIDKINPKNSIISVGKNNKYNHPNNSVLDTLKQSNIYRTDIDGSIVFKIKNDKLEVETYMP